MFLPQRVMDKIIVDKDGCWMWQGALTSTGYGNMTVGLVRDGTKRWVKPHRFVYEQLVAPLGETRLDHLCRVPPCVNPKHLEPVTQKENIARGVGHGSETQCPQGHAYDAKNTYRNQGKRYCRTCARAAARNWTLKHRKLVEVKR